MNLVKKYVPTQINVHISRETQIFTQTQTHKEANFHMNLYLK